MRIEKFIDKIGAADTTPKVREIAQKAVSQLRAKDVSTAEGVEVDQETYDMIMEITGISQTVGMVYKWMSVYNRFDERVDIRTKKLRR